MCWVCGNHRQPASGPGAIGCCQCDTLLLQDLLAEQAQQHIVGRRVLGVQLEALALEVLHRAALFGQLIGERVAEHRQAAVLLPVLRKAPADAMAGLGKTGSLLRLGGQGASE